MNPTCKNEDPEPVPKNDDESPVYFNTLSKNQYAKRLKTFMCRELPEQIY